MKIYWKVYLKVKEKKFNKVNRQRNIYFYFSFTEIGNLPKLRVLECCKNKITYIPISLAKCLALEELNLNDNETLYEVPCRILSLPRLEYIYVERKLNGLKLN